MQPKGKELLQRLHREQAALHKMKALQSHLMADLQGKIQEIAPDLEVHVLVKVSRLDQKVLLTEQGMY